MKQFLKGKWLSTLIFFLVVGIAMGYALSFNSQNDSQVSNEQNIDKQEDRANTDNYDPTIFELITPKPETIDKPLIEDTIFNLVNDLREELNVNPVIKNETLRLAADIRAIETEELFSHTRPNGTEPFTVLEEESTYYPYYMIGENLAMATYFRDDEHMAHLIFNGWVESEDHYQTMINPDFKEIGIGVHYDGEILYASQFFGLVR